jgi:hypothetical protein
MEPRFDYTLKVENLTADEVNTVLRLLHGTGFVAKVIDVEQRARRVCSEED